MQLDLMIEDSRWRTIALADLATAATDAVLSHVGLEADDVEVSVLACDDKRISVLNAEFRGKPVPTNVLSWPSVDLSPQKAGDMPRRPVPDPDGTCSLGDIALAWDTCAREAEAASKTMTTHVTHLVVHGVLHLLGFDHITEPDAARMEALEVEILGKLGLDDPYRETDGN